jgi:hypothetical protein
MSARPELTERDGYEALRGHVVDKALAARKKHGPVIDADAIRRLLADPEVVRFPTTLAFDAGPLQAGEFAWAAPRGERPSAGFTLHVHPCFEADPEALPYLVAYHLPTINYLDVVTHREAELFGAALLGLEVEEYYQRLCAFAARLPGAPAGAPAEPPPLEEERLEPEPHRCACGSTGGCSSRG